MALAGTFLAVVGIALIAFGLRLLRTFDVRGGGYDNAAARSDRGREMIVYGLICMFGSAVLFAGDALNV